MHLLLSNLLKKRGIKDVEELSKEEKEWFKEKERILSLKDEITGEDVKKFCLAQKNIIEDQFFQGNCSLAFRIVNIHLFFHALFSIVLSI